MKKRVLAMLMAIVMVLSQAAVVYADGGSGSVEIYSDDFQGQTVDQIPAGWTQTAEITTASADPDTANPSNQVMKVAPTAKSQTVTYKFDEPTSDVVTLEYRFKISNSAPDAATQAKFFLPALMYDTAVKRWMPLSLRVTGTKLYYRDGIYDSSKWNTAYTGLAYDTWYEIKLVVDIKEEKVALELNGAPIDLAKGSNWDFRFPGATYKEEVVVPADAKIGAVILGGSLGSGDPTTITAYIDDIKVTKPAAIVDDGVNTEAELIAAIAEGGNIVITGDITLTQQVNVTKDVTISAETPKTITVSIASGSTGEAFGGLHVTGGTLTLGENLTVTNVDSAASGVSTVTTTGADAKLIVKGATVTSACKNNAIEAANGSYVTIESGHVYGQQFTAAYASGGATIEVKGGKVGHEDYNFYGLIASKTAATTGGKIVISGGEVRHVLAHEAESSEVTISGGTINGSVSAKNGASVAISGGTFNNKPDSQYLANGFEVKDNADGTYSVQEKVYPEKVSFWGDNLELGNNLNMAFIFAKDQRPDWSGYTAEVTMNGQTTVYTLDQWMTDNTGNYYYIYFTGIYAKMMTDEVSVVIYDGEHNAVSETFTTSIKEYATELMAKEPAKTNMLIALLNYGAESQLLLNYKTDKLANAGLN